MLRLLAVKRCGACQPPILRESADGKRGFLCCPPNHVHEDFPRIDEGVVAIELRREGSNFIPKNRVFDLNESVARDMPSLLVDFLERHTLVSDVRLNFLDAACEIFDLVERIPCWHPQERLASYRNPYQYMEKMTLRIPQGDLVRDRRGGVP